MFLFKQQKKIHPNVKIKFYTVEILMGNLCVAQITITQWNTFLSD